MTTLVIYTTTKENMRKKENIFQAQLINTTSVNLNQSQESIDSLYLQERFGAKWSL
jgi:hypothetical protein